MEQIYPQPGCLKPECCELAAKSAGISTLIAYRHEASTKFTTNPKQYSFDVQRRNKVMRIKQSTIIYFIY